MRIDKVEYPYSTMYKRAYITTNDEGRKLVIFIKDGKAVHGTPYARYLMAVKLGRFLTSDEQVDHIDNDRTNDVIENLQILTQEENIKKYNMLNPPQHGSLRMYRNGCRCDMCKKCKSDYMKKYYTDHPDKREQRNMRRRKSYNL